MTEEHKPGFHLHGTDPWMIQVRLWAEKHSIELTYEAALEMRTHLFDAYDQGKDKGRRIEQFLASEDKS